MIKVLHFADAHIDMVRQGKRDPETGLPVRSLDFLRALDTIVDTAISEQVDLVVFAGDAYRDRTPSPTYQREWGKRIFRLSSAGIMTILVVGNHDLSPALGRAHTLHEFSTLAIPNTRVIKEPCFLKPEDLNDIPVQIIGIPWISKLELPHYKEFNDFEDSEDLSINELITKKLEEWTTKLDPSIPAILTSHVTAQGATYGNERSVILGKDVILPSRLLKDHSFDYVALGHIHKYQNLNEGSYPPVVYPGSIERLDFGEVNDLKGFVVAQIEKGKTTYEFHPIKGRKFIDLQVTIESEQNVTEQILQKFPAVSEMSNAIMRLILHYERKWEGLIDEKVIRKKASEALEFYFIRKPITHPGIQISSGQPISQISPQELLEKYWGGLGFEDEKIKTLISMAMDILSGAIDQENESMQQLKIFDKDADNDTH